MRGRVESGGMYVIAEVRTWKSIPGAKQTKKPTCRVRKCDGTVTTRHRGGLKR